jgi:competence protein ComGC
MSRAPARWAADRAGLGALAIIVALLILAVLSLGYFQMQSAMRDQKTTLGAIDTSKAFACKANRQTVEREIQMWLVDHPGETPSLAALEADGVRPPTCPEGGTYSVEGVRVRCSTHD